MYPYGPFWSGFHWWWLVPVAMMVFCFIMMHRRGGCIMGHRRSRESAREILARRYASGEIGKEEYEEKKRHITQ